jgi:hypothetical protein
MLLLVSLKSVATGTTCWQPCTVVRCILFLSGGVDAQCSCSFNLCTYLFKAYAQQTKTWCCMLSA